MKTYKLIALAFLLMVGGAYMANEASNDRVGAIGFLIACGGLITLFIAVVRGRDRHELTKEEILSDNYRNTRYTGSIDDDGGETWQRKDALLAMEEYRTQCDELPGDDVVNKQAKVSCKGNSHAMRYHHMLEQFREGAKWMRSLASPAIASRDARIRELEKALRSIEIGADPRNEYQALIMDLTLQEVLLTNEY
jgi:hypothetical protein